MKINTKEDIINYFQSGYKKSLLIGVENEKFLLEKDTSKRANYEQIKNILNYLKKFGWEEILEGNLVDFGFASLRVFTGDISNTLTEFNSKVDCWYLDGFAPSKNPEMWTDYILKLVALRTKHGGSFSTYTAAGHVWRSLELLGFEVIRQKGFSKKRHMIRGTKIAND